MKPRAQLLAPDRPIPRKGGLGFTWIELLIVVGIAAILASYFVVADHGYKNRSQASEAVSLLMAAKAPLAEHFHDHQKWPVSLDKVVKETSGRYTRSVAITRGAGGTGEIELTATMKTDADSRVAGHTVQIRSADGGRNWICRPGTMPAKNLPASCRD